MYHIGRQWFLDLKMNPEKHFENNLGDNLEASTNIMLCHFSQRSSQSRKFGLLECSICLQNILGREPVTVNVVTHSAGPASDNPFKNTTDVLIVMLMLICWIYVPSILRLYYPYDYYHRRVSILLPQ